MLKIENGPHKFRQLITRTALPLALFLTAPQIANSRNPEPQQPNLSESQAVLYPPTLVDFDSGVRVGSHIIAINRRPNLGQFASTVPNKYGLADGAYDPQEKRLKFQIKQEFDKTIHQVTRDNQFIVAMGDRAEGQVSTDGSMTWTPVASPTENAYQIQTNGLVALPGANKAIIHELVSASISAPAVDRFRMIDDRGQVLNLNTKLVSSTAQKISTEAFNTPSGTKFFSLYEGPVEDAFIENRVTNDGLEQILRQVPDPNVDKYLVLGGFTRNSIPYLILSGRNHDPIARPNPRYLTVLNTDTDQTTQIPFQQPTKGGQIFSQHERQMLLANSIVNAVSAVGQEGTVCFETEVDFKSSETNWTGTMGVSCASLDNVTDRVVYNRENWQDASAKLSIMQTVDGPILIAAYDNKGVVSKSLLPFNSTDNQPWNVAELSIPQYRLNIPILSDGGTLLK